MTEQPQKPKRWRRLVIAFLLSIVLLGIWWNWPRGDVRLVGKWALPNAGNGAKLTAEFDRRRTGTISNSAAPQITTHFAWRVERDALVISSARPGRGMGFWAKVFDRFGRLTGIRLPALDQEYELQFLDGAHIHLTRPSSAIGPVLLPMGVLSRLQP